MQAVILAAGKGTRMGALTEHTPKPMLPLLGRPMLAWRIDMLPEEIDEVILIVGYLREQIESYFGDVWHGRRIRYAVQETLDGSGGAAHLVKDMVKGAFLITNGDDLYLESDLKRLMRSAPAVLGLTVNHAESYGLLEADAEGNLFDIIERPHGRKSGVVNVGAYMLIPEFFEYPLVPVTETEFGLPQTLASMKEDTAIRVVVAEAWQPVGTPEDRVLGEEFLKQHVPELILRSL